MAVVPRKSQRHGLSSVVSWWPVLLPPLAVPFTVLCDQEGWSALLAKSLHETIAPPLLALVVLAWLVAAARARSVLLAGVAVLSAAFLCREIHFEGSKPIVYLAVFGGGWLAWRRRVALAPDARAWRARTWFVAAIAGYALSQIIAHRWFRFVPGEIALHVPLEEMTETASHLLLATAAVLTLLPGGFVRARGAAADSAGAVDEAGTTGDVERAAGAAVVARGDEP